MRDCTFQAFGPRLRNINIKRRDNACTYKKFNLSSLHTDFHHSYNKSVHTPNSTDAIDTTSWASTPHLWLPPWFILLLHNTTNPDLPATLAASFQQITPNNIYLYLQIPTRSHRQTTANFFTSKTHHYITNPPAPTTIMNSASSPAEGNANQTQDILSVLKGISDQIKTLKNDVCDMKGRVSNLEDSDPPPPQHNHFKNPSKPRRSM